MSWVYSILRRRRGTGNALPQVADSYPILGLGGVSIQLSLAAGGEPSRDAFSLAEDALHSYVSKLANAKVRPDETEIRSAIVAGDFLLVVSRDIGSNDTEVARLRSDRSILDRLALGRLRRPSSG